MNQKELSELHMSIICDDKMMNFITKQKWYSDLEKHKQAEYLVLCERKILNLCTEMGLSKVEILRILNQVGKQITLEVQSSY